MLSTVETGRGPQSVHQQLHEIERGETAAWVVYPPTPIWWPVGYGLWAAAFALVVGVLDGSAQSLAQLGLVVTIALTMAWDRRRRGTYPSGRPPRELNPVILRMLLGTAVVAGSAWLAGEQVGVWLAVVIAGVGAFAVVARYEKEYAAVAALIRERLT